MKVTMLKTMCGPEGNAFPGQPVSVQDSLAKEMLEHKFARKYDADKDKKKPVGPFKAVDRFA